MHPAGPELEQRADAEGAPRPACDPGNPTAAHEMLEVGHGRDEPDAPGDVGGRARDGVDRRAVGGGACRGQHHQRLRARRGHGVDDAGALADVAHRDRGRVV